MQSHLDHIQINIAGANLAFYKELLTFLGWQLIFEMENAAGMLDKNGVSVWFIGYANDARNDYDGAGMNHLAFGVGSVAEVDRAVAYLTEKGVTPLFETPRHRPEFAQGSDQTYYQVMFESPDRVLLEVVYRGPLG